MKLIVFAGILLLAASMFAADGRQVTYKAGSDTVTGMFYAPAGKGPVPALVVIHEYWGLNDWVKEQASKLADRGYAALAVDLYRGKVATTPEEAHELMRGVPEDRARQDLLAAAAFLRSQKQVDPARVGTIGWCMGGGYAFDLAVDDPNLKAAVINYGHISTLPDTLKRINAAVLGIFGSKDRGILVEDLRRFEQEMKALGKEVEIVIFPDAGHAFENPNNKEGYRPEDAAKAWKITQEFLASNLKGGK